MGFYSWKCAISKKSISNTYTNLPQEYSDCYLVTPGKTYHEKNYAGFGVFDGVDIYELLGREIVGEEEAKNKDLYELRDIGIFQKKPFEIKVVLAAEYNGQLYEELPKSEDCPYDGHFFDEEYYRFLGLVDYFCDECGRLKDECECDCCPDCGVDLDYCICDYY